MAMVFRLAAAASAIAFATGAAGTWTRVAPLPHPRSAHAVVANNTGVYVLGGPATAAVDRFDGARWTRETTLPGGIVNAPAAALVGDSIVVTGGFRGATNEPTSAVRIYDLRSRTWHDGAALPAPRGGHAAVVLDGKVHVIGGGNSVSTIADHSVYDPAADRWSSAAPLPRVEGSPAAVVFRGHIYALGGRSGFRDFGDVFVYDAGSDRWSRAPSLPPRGTAGAAVYRGSIFVFGGESQSRSATLGDVYRLAAGAKKWARVGAMPTKRSYARAVVFDDAVYVVGGSRLFGDVHAAAGSRVVERFTLPRR
jgi:N-acetylneuraminic acid mutarotase